MLILLLTLILARPLVSSVTFDSLNYLYLCALLLSLTGWIIIKGLDTTRIKSLRLPILTLVAGLLLSFLLSKRKLISAYELSYYYTGILMMCIVPSLSESGRKRLIACILFSGLAVSILAIYQYFFVFARLERYIVSQRITDGFVLDYVRRRRVFFPFVTPNVLAGFLAMVIPLALIKKKYVFCLLPLGAALILTQSLGALFSLFLAFVFYFFLSGKLGKKSFILGGIFLLLVLIVISRFSMAGAHSHPNFSTIMRLRYWQDTFAVILKSPMAGTGMGNFNLAYSRFTHNSYLQFWAENGIISLAAILWLCGAIIGKRIKSKLSPEYLALLTANAAFILHNAIDFTFFLPEVSLAWWALLGLLI